MRRLKPRHERFCRSFVECTNASVAAKVAGYAPTSARNAGYRLLRHPRIAERIAQIQQETAEVHCRNVDVLLGKLETIYRRAVDDHHFSAAARAVELQAKLAGIGPALPRTTGRGRASVAVPADGGDVATSGLEGGGDG
jgi:phage terminase small subunit